MVHHRRVHLIGVHKSTQHGRARTLVLQTIRGERDNHYATVPKIQNCAAEVNNFHTLPPPKKHTHPSLDGHGNIHNMCRYLYKGYMTRKFVYFDIIKTNMYTTSKVYIKLYYR